MDKRKQGDIGVAEAIRYYTRLGYEVFHPLTEATRVDLIALKGTEILRIQCKTCVYRVKNRNSYSVNLVTSGGNQSWSREVSRISSEEVDIVFIWCGNDSIWVVPSSVVEGKRKFTAGYINREYHVDGPEPVKPDYSFSRNRTSSGENKTQVQKPNSCSECGVLISRGALTCRKHTSYARPTKADWPSIDKLIESIKESSYLAVGNSLGVSDNAVRKHLRTRGYDTKTFELVD